MLRRILDEVRQEVLREERRLLGALRVVLVRHEAPAETQKALVHSITQLDELFMLVVVGEFNAGKSSVINALLGDRILEEGPTPTTARIGLLKYGPTESRASAGSHEAIMLPLPILQEISIVDTPGTNAVVREHEALTRDFVPRSDLVLFVTSADRPFTESERQFLAAIQSWGKKVVVAVNKVDILETKDVAAVLDFVKEKLLALLGLRPRVFAVSARQARQARTKGNDGLWQASGFSQLESFVTGTLHESVRVRLKLLSPLGVGLKGLGEAESAVEARAGGLEDDVRFLEEIDGQLARHREDLVRGVRLRLAEVDKAVVDFERRGRDFLSDTLRLSRVVDLLSPERLRADFTRRVVGDLPRVLEKRVDEIVDWMVAQRVGHWQGLRERLAHRQAVHGPRTGLRDGGSAEYDPSQPPGDVRREAQRALDGHDLEGEAARLAEQSRLAVVGLLLLMLGALAVAGASFAFGATATARLSGLLVAGAFSASGLLWLALRRTRAQLDLAERAAVLRGTLTNRLRSKLEQEVDADRKRAQAAIDPYQRFVRGETERLQGQRAELGELRKNLQGLKARIETL